MIIRLTRPKGGDWYISADAIAEVAPVHPAYNVANAECGPTVVVMKGEHDDVTNTVQETVEDVVWLWARALDCKPIGASDVKR